MNDDLAETAAVASRHKTVLLIDDSESARQAAHQALLREGMFDQYLFAEDGAKGLKVLMQNAVDVVVCDLMMPYIDGYKFLMLKREADRDRNIPVIMLTSEGDVAAKIRAIEAGASDYVTKPFHDAELVARVRVHLQLKLLRDELQARNTQLEQLSNTDPLTKLVNRRYFAEHLDLEFLRAERYGTALSFVMLDIDHFKSVNDTYGHPVGDLCLVTIATLLRNGMRKHDVVCRYGGEEFALLLPHTPQEGAQIVAERYRREIETTQVRHDGGSFRVTASMGVATCPHEEVETIEDLIARADTALYRAKERGRNRVLLAM